jgi:TonB family protein
MRIHGYFPARPRALQFFLCLLLGLLSLHSANAQGSDLDGIASRLSGAIIASSRGLYAKPTVLVMDFTETHSRPNELGARLADTFSTLLDQNARDFVVSGRDSRFEAFRIGWSSKQIRNDTSAPDCSAGQPKPTIVVDGYTDNLTDRLAIRVKATRIEDSKVIFDERTAVPFTPELQSLEPKLLSSPATPSALTGLAWVRPGFHIPDDEARVPPPDKSQTPPTCLYCPIAKYPDSAMSAKIQGTVELRLLVDQDGNPAEIIVLKGLPCGLSEQAVKAVATWRLSPAKDAGGKPIATWQHAEAEFRVF